MNTHPILPSIDEILGAGRLAKPEGDRIGHSREGRPVAGYRFGSGTTRLSLIAGCHADEPVGPMLLESLVRYLGAVAPGSDVLTRFDWWIVPHINPDGAERNRAWSGTGAGDAAPEGGDGTRKEAGRPADVAGATGVPEAYDFATYLRHVVRELPGDDIEFGFPRSGRDAGGDAGDDAGDDAGGDAGDDAGDDAGGDAGARPEPRAVVDWWRTDPRPFSMHMSLHGMAFAAGPWYLIDPAWADRSDIVIERCRAATAEMGYRLHDIQRHGEKGFTRIARGFCTRPDSRAMAAHFHGLGDSATASLFRPSSMETIRSFGGGTGSAAGGDALTLVSEMPLFTLPGVGDIIEPVDPAAERWRERIMEWKGRIERNPEEEAAVRDEAAAEGVRPVPIRDQLELQWRFICAGIEQISG